MKRTLAGLYTAHGLMTGLWARQVALLVNWNSRRVHIGVGDPGLADETAAVCLMQNYTADLGWAGWHVYLTYEPTLMCLGILWRGGVETVSYQSQGRIWQVRVTQNTIGASQAYDPNTDPEVDPTAALNMEGQYHGRFRPPEHAIRALGVIGPLPYASSGPDFHEELFMRVVYSLIRWGWNDDVPREQRRVDIARPFGNNIAAVMVNANTNQIVAWGLNMKRVNATFHAETLMLQELLRRNGGLPDLRHLPGNCHIYTSLQCCHMCGNYIKTMFGMAGKRVKVFYAQVDPQIQGGTSLGDCGCEEQSAVVALRHLDLPRFDRPQAKTMARELIESQRERDVRQATPGTRGTIPFLFSPEASTMFGGEALRYRWQSGEEFVRPDLPPEERLIRSTQLFLHRLERLSVLRGVRYV